MTGRFSKGTLDHDGDGRMGGSRKANDMTDKGKAAHATNDAKADQVRATQAKAETKPKATGKNAKLMEEYPAEFEAGRRAGSAGIPEDQAPHAEGKQLDAWKAGRDSVEVREI